MKFREVFKDNPELLAVLEQEGIADHEVTSGHVAAAGHALFNTAYTTGQMGQFFRGEDADNEEIQRLAIEYLEDMISLLLKYRKNHRVVVEIVDAGVGSPLPAGFAKQIGWPHEAGGISEKLHAYCETELVLLIHEARATERLLVEGTTKDGVEVGGKYLSDEILSKVRPKLEKAYLQDSLLDLPARLVKPKVCTKGYLEGIDLLSKGQLDSAEQALRRFKKATDEDANDLGSLVQMARILMGQGCYKGSYESQLIDLGDILILSAEYYCPAMTLLDTALQIDKDDIGAHFNYGLINAYRGEVEDAVAHFEHVKKSALDEVRARALLNLSFLYRLVGQQEAAHTAKEEAKTLQPNIEKVKHKATCAIATAVLGWGAVDDLRSLYTFRDRFLKKKAAGRLMIRLYYLCSPWLLRLMREMPLLKKAVYLLVRNATWIARKFIDGRNR